MPSPDRRGETRQPAPALPTPLSAALGLAAASVQGVRRLPGTAVKAPVQAVGYALAVTDNLRREYEELAERGEALLGRLRGHGLARLDSAGRTVTSLVDNAGETLVEGGREAAQGVRAGAGTGLRATAEGVDAVADRVEDAATQVAGAATGAADTAAGAAETAARSAQQATRRATERATEAAARASAAGQPDRAREAEARKSEPTPERPGGRVQRRDSAAETAVREEVESVTQAVGGDRVPDAGELPIPNFDHLSLAQIRGRLRRLTVEELVLLRNYERAHGDRLPIVTMLDNRISKVADDSTPGGSSAVAPGAAGGGGDGTAAGGATDSAAGRAAGAGPTGWPGGTEGGGATAEAAPGATGWPDTSGPGAAGGDGLAGGGPTVAATTEAAPSVPAGADAAGDR